MKKSTQTRKQGNELSKSLDDTKARTRAPPKTSRKPNVNSSTPRVNKKAVSASAKPLNVKDGNMQRVRSTNRLDTGTVNRSHKPSIKRPVPSSNSGKVPIKQTQTMRQSGPKPSAVKTGPKTEPLRKGKTQDSPSMKAPKRNEVKPTKTLKSKTSEERQITSHRSVAVLVRPAPVTALMEDKTEVSLWKRIKKMSSVKIISAWKTDQQPETCEYSTNTPMASGEDAQVHNSERSCVSPDIKPSKTGSTDFIDQLSTAKSSTVVQDDSVLTVTSLASKSGQFEIPPLTPRTLNDNSLEHQDDPKKSLSVRSYSQSPKPSSSSSFDHSPSPPLEETENASQNSSVLNPPCMGPMDSSSMESCFANESVKMNEQDAELTVVSETPCFAHHAQKCSDPESIIYNPMASLSPELVPHYHQEKSAGLMSYGALHVPNTSYVENNFDYFGMQSSRSPLRRVDSARIGAQCEFLRDTIKEESKRVVSMTSLLEAMNSAPTNSSGQHNVELFQNQEISRRQAEKIHDLEMENQHLRQLLEFSIGSIRRRHSWMPNYTSEGEQSYGPAFNNPIPVLEQADKELVSKTAVKNKQTKHKKGEKSKADKQQIDQLQQSLESKDVLLKVITESICQISSMHGYYQKRLEDLENDRNSIQVERSEHLNVTNSIVILTVLKQLFTGVASFWN
eukprot:g4858.t1